MMDAFGGARDQGDDHKAGEHCSDAKSHVGGARSTPHLHAHRDKSTGQHVEEVRAVRQSMQRRGWGALTWRPKAVVEAG